MYGDWLNESDLIEISNKRFNHNCVDFPRSYQHVSALIRNTLQDVAQVAAEHQLSTCDNANFRKHICITNSSKGEVDDGVHWFVVAWDADLRKPLEAMMDYSSLSPLQQASLVAELMQVRVIDPTSSASYSRQLVGELTDMGIDVTVTTLGYQADSWKCGYWSCWIVETLLSRLEHFMEVAIPVMSSQYEETLMRIVRNLHHHSDTPHRRSRSASPPLIRHMLRPSTSPYRVPNQPTFAPFHANDPWLRPTQLLNTAPTAGLMSSTRLQPSPQTVPPLQRSSSQISLSDDVMSEALSPTQSAAASPITANTPTDWTVPVVTEYHPQNRVDTPAPARPAPPQQAVMGAPNSTYRVPISASTPAHQTPLPSSEYRVLNNQGAWIPIRVVNTNPSINPLNPPARVVRQMESHDTPYNGFISNNNRTAVPVSLPRDRYEYDHHHRHHLRKLLHNLHSRHRETA